MGAIGSGMVGLFLDPALCPWHFPALRLRFQLLLTSWRQTGYKIAYWITWRFSICSSITYQSFPFDLYREDIVFRDPLNTFVGIENYKSIFWALRFHGRIFFKALWMDIVSVWQPVENVIMVRWTVHGIPRVPWEGHGRFDGTSEYKLDKHGKIYEHRVHNIALNAPPPKFRVLAVDELLQSIGCSSTPKPTYFEISPSPVMNSLPSLVKFAWVREYMTSVFASSRRHKGGSST